MDEDDVGVTAVSDLATPETSHADDEEARGERPPGLGLVGTDDLLQGDLEQGARKIGEGGTDLLDRQMPLEIGHGEPEQLRSPDGPGAEHSRIEFVPSTGSRPHPGLDVGACPRLYACAIAEELDAVGRLLEQGCREPAPTQRVCQTLGGAPRRGAS